MIPSSGLEPNQVMSSITWSSGDVVHHQPGLPALIESEKRTPVLDLPNREQMALDLSDVRGQLVEALVFEDSNLWTEMGR